MEKDKKPSKWLKTRHANLRKLRATGVYYVHATINGQNLNRSLDTQIEEVAMARKDKAITEAKRAAKRVVRKQNMDRDIFSTVMTSALQERARRMGQNPKTTRYNSECAKIIARLLPNVGSPIRSITTGDMNRLQDALQMHYAATRHNGCLSVLKWTFNKAIADGLIASNPATHLQRCKVEPKEFFLPSDEQFREIVGRLQERKRSEAWALVMVLALTGCRISEAKQLTVGDIDWEAGLISISARLKNGNVRIQPILDDLAPALKGLCKNKPPTDRLLPRVDARRELKEISEAMKLPLITHHTLRKYFITKALEAGIDPFTVTAWVGHKDIKTTMRHYHKVRMMHSKKEAKKMDFGLSEESNVIPMTRQK